MKSGKKKMVMFDKNEIKKDLYKSKVMAQFSHYCHGKLYYKIVVMEELYQFPISTVEEGPTFNDDESGLSMYEIETVVLSSDLGTTEFGAEIKGSELNRWIAKAIDKGEFIKVG
jgi:hypothetical protein